MQKASFLYQPTAEELEETRKLAEDLKKHPVIVSLCKNEDIPVSAIDKSPWKFKKWLQEYEPCTRCTGLNHCGQKTKGYFNQLVFDGILQVEKKACKYQRELNQANKHMQYYLVNDMPSYLNQADLSKIDLSKEENEYISVFTSCYEACSENTGMYLYGTMGSGKTYLAACAANYYAKNGNKVAFIHYPTFVQRMASLVTTKEYRDELETLSYVRFLVIDDIGAENVTEWNRDSILLPLLSARYEKNLITWFTSNEDFDSLLDHFKRVKGKEEIIKAERILERIRSMSKPKALTTKDRRKYL